LPVSRLVSVNPARVRRGVNYERALLDCLRGHASLHLLRPQAGSGQRGLLEQLHSEDQRRGRAAFRKYAEHARRLEQARTAAAVAFGYSQCQQASVAQSGDVISRKARFAVMTRSVSGERPAQRLQAEVLDGCGWGDVVHIMKLCAERKVAVRTGIGSLHIRLLCDKVRAWAAAGAFRDARPDRLEHRAAMSGRGTALRLTNGAPSA
jgi:hypothetical protein